MSKHLLYSISNSSRISSCRRASFQTSPGTPLGLGDLPCLSLRREVHSSDLVNGALRFKGGGKTFIFKNGRGGIRVIRILAELLKF